MAHGLRILNDNGRLQIDDRARCYHKVPSLTFVGASGESAYGDVWRFDLNGAFPDSEYVLIAVPFIANGAVAAGKVTRNFVVTQPDPERPALTFTRYEFTVYGKNAAGQKQVPAPIAFTPLPFPAAGEGFGLQILNDFGGVIFDSRAFPLFARARISFPSGSGPASSTVNLTGMAEPGIIAAIACSGSQNWQYYQEPNPPFDPGGNIPYTRLTDGGFTWNNTAVTTIGRDGYAFSRNDDPFGGTFVSNAGQTFQASSAIILDLWRYR